MAEDPLALTSEPVVTVIMAAYNAAPFLGRAVESVKQQSFDRWELIIVDDLSTDDTFAVAQSYAGSDPRISVLRLPKNGGPGAARNAGIAAARGQWIAPLDADDRYSRDRLEVLIKLCEQQSFDMLADNQFFYDEKVDQIIGTGGPENLSLRDWNFSTHINAEIEGWSKNFTSGLRKPLISLKFLKENNIRYNGDLRFGEDFLLYTDLILAGAKAAITHQAFYIYTMPYGTMSGQSSGLSRTRGDISDTIRLIDYIIEMNRTRLTADQLALLQKLKAHRMRTLTYLQFRGYIRAGKSIDALLTVIRNPGLLSVIGQQIVRKTAPLMKAN